MIGANLIEELKTIAAISNRVYPLKAPQNTEQPYIVVAQIGNDRDYTHDGASGLNVASFRVNIYGLSLTQVKAISGDVSDTLDGWNTSGVQFAKQTNDLELYEDDTQLNHIVIEYDIMWKK